MKTLVIYDEAGYILDVRSGTPEPREPIGVPFLWVDDLEGKQLKAINEIGVDVSVTPHQPILEDIPPTDMEIIKIELKATQEALDFLLMGGM